jgi:hypothetical protein
MRVEFYRSDDPETVVGAALWDGRRVVIDEDDKDVRAAFSRVFRLTPVVVDDASLRTLGAGGEALLEPGSLEWFEAAANRRGPEEGFAVRVVPEAVGRGGWDPASAYRTFRQSVRRLVVGQPAEPEGDDEPSPENSSRT